MVGDTSVAVVPSVADGGETRIGGVECVHDILGRPLVCSRKIFIWAMLPRRLRRASPVMAVLGHGIPSLASCIKERTDSKSHSASPRRRLARRMASWLRPSHRRSPKIVWYRCRTLISVTLSGKSPVFLVRWSNFVPYFPGRHLTLKSNSSRNSAYRAY